MARRAKLTGFSRFLIAMTIIAPLAFIGASYYNGEDGLENFKKLIGMDGAEHSSITIGEQHETGGRCIGAGRTSKPIERRGTEAES